MTQFSGDCRVSASGKTFLFIWHLTFSNSLSPVWEKESKKGRERSFYSVRLLIGVLKDGNHCEMQVKTNTDSESGLK